MAAFRAEFTHVVHHSEVENDLSSFWLRKSQKPVLAVLLVQKPGQPFKLYRGEFELKIFALLFENCYFIVFVPNLCYQLRSCISYLFIPYCLILVSAPIHT